MYLRMDNYEFLKNVYIKIKQTQFKIKIIMNPIIISN